MDQMTIDAGSAIVGAIASGALDGVKEEVKGRVVALVERVREAFTGDEDALADLSVYARRAPEDMREVMLENLERYGVIEDAEVVEEARSILTAVGPAASGAGSVAANVVNQTVNGGGSAFTGGQHTITNNFGQAPAGTAAPKWELTHHRGDTYMLENIGAGTAYDVSLSMAANVFFRPPHNADSTWAPDDGRTFMAKSGMGCSAEVRVAYALTPGGEPKHWSRALPPKP